jgi:very-short-patch-repair endonuclease
MKDPTAGPLALRLARYLREIVQMRTTVTTDVDQYNQVLWLDQVPRHDLCGSPAWAPDWQDPDLWLEVRKPTFPDPPPLPLEVKPWVDPHALLEPTAEPPRLARSILEYPPPRERPFQIEGDEQQEPPMPVEISLADRPRVSAAYVEYVPRWLAWAVQTRRLREVQETYAELFRIHSSLDSEGDRLELVLGIGLLQAPADSLARGQNLRRHVAVAQAVLEFDTDEGVMRVRCPDSGSQPQFEEEMIDHEKRPDATTRASVNRALEDLDNDYWDRDRAERVLAQWGQALHARCRWLPDLAPGPRRGDDPEIRFAPALIVRSRGQRGLLRVYGDIIRQLEEAGDDVSRVPPGWRLLIGSPSGPSGGRYRGGGAVDRSTQGAGSKEPVEVLLPLPANREQREIAEKVEQQSGLLVQGPPGTGKSHTIANLICHMLAQGRRVLVTAESARALNVLREKLPEDLRPLCISVLGGGRDSFHELSSVVHGIVSKHATWSDEVAIRETQELRAKLELTRRDLTRLDRELLQHREAEVHPVTLGGRGGLQGTRSEIARQVARDSIQHGWLELTEEAGEEPAVSDGDALAFWQACREIAPEVEADCGAALPELNDLCTPEQFATLIEAERDARHHHDAGAAARAHASYSRVRLLSLADRLVLDEALRDLEEDRNRVLARAWAKDMALAVLEGRDVANQRLCDASRARLDALRRLAEKLGGSAVELPRGHHLAALRNDLGATVQHLLSGGKWKVLGIKTPAALKGRVYVRDATVNGARANDAAKLGIVLDEVERRLAMEDVAAAWRGREELTLDQPPSLFEAQLNEILSQADAARSWAARALLLAGGLPRLEYGGEASAVTCRGWLESGVTGWLDAIAALARDDQLLAARESLAPAMRAVEKCAQRPDAHPLVRELAEAIAARDLPRYRSCYADLTHAWRVRARVSMRDRIGNAIRSAAPALERSIRETRSEAHWHDRLAALHKAWGWATANKKLKEWARADHLDTMHSRRRTLQASVQDLTARLAANLAWTRFFARLTEDEVRALKSWREAVRQLGKGTGKSQRTERLRREARRYLEQCREAIPAWIMPRTTVGDMVEARPGRFDAVIIDEASQLSIDSLFLFYLADQQIVVGDDMQISPSNVGMREEAIARLQDELLHDAPARVTLNSQASVYSSAKVFFGVSVTLREHFRCMPEIIQFSNDICYAPYNTPLDPLRNYPPDRLEPLMSQFVADGRREGEGQHARNVPEAEAIVERIALCIADPSYRGKTMGVISLLANGQAREIERRLLKRFDPEELKARRLLCGDAYSFQGDERDVLFLSMVAAPGETRITAQTSDTYRQRFNVAASRAKDQMWVFHSIRQTDLSPQCFRHQLLDYVNNPRRRQDTAEAPKFDSEFERLVYERIVARGFRVRSQVHVGSPRSAFRIDLVVEGMRGRLAVECDGDQWHGPERFEADMARQRDLERVGWEFFRVRGSAFHRDPTSALERLWHELARRGIHASAAAAEHKTAAPRETGAPGVAAPRAENTQERSPSPRSGEDRRGGFAAASGNGTTPPGRPDPTPETEEEDVVDDRVWDEAPEPRNERTQPTSKRSDVANSSSAKLDGDPPDPRVATTEEVAKWLLEMIQAHGPAPSRSIYRRYLEGAGFVRLTRQAAHHLDRALRSLQRAGRIEVVDEFKQRGADRIVRQAGTPAVRMRGREGRDFEDVPPSEFAAMLAQLVGSLPIHQCDHDELFRAVLEQYGFPSLTSKRRSCLARAWELMLEARQQKPDRN